MTFLDKLKHDYPKKDLEYAIVYECPYEYGYEKLVECKVEPNEYICRRCWNREIPSEVQQAEPSCDDVKAAYEEGLNDAWKLANKILCLSVEDSCSFRASEVRKIYGTTDIAEIFKLSPHEAMAKMKEYEELHKIQVGDVVEYDDGIIGVVTYITNNNRLYGIDSIGCVFRDVPFEAAQKLGRKIDVQSIFEQIGGE